MHAKVGRQNLQLPSGKSEIFFLNFQNFEHYFVEKFATRPAERVAIGFSWICTVP
jgi:hypothetical protein